MSFAEAVGPRLDGGSCPHMAVVLRSGRELPAVLVSFYALGARRGGWVVHHALPGQCARDRERLAAGGLDVGELETAGALVLFEFDPAEAPEDAAERFEPLLAAALGYVGFDWVALRIARPSASRTASCQPLRWAMRSAASSPAST